MRLRKAFPAIVVTPVFLNFTLSEHRLARGGRGGLPITKACNAVAALALDRASSNAMRIGSQRSRRKLAQRSYNSTRTRVAGSIPQMVSSSGPTPTLRIHISHVVLMTAAAKVSDIAATRVVTSVHHNIMQAIASKAVNHAVGQD
jgi:hypothetical protein